MDGEDHKLLQFLAATVESVRDRMVTREDSVALRDQMSRALESLREQMATKQELTTIREQMATRQELAALREQMATKQNLAALRDEMVSSFTAVRGDIERVHLRLDGVDRAVTTRMDQVDNQISRLRSVVYLLGKDRPEVLRLLGDAPV